MERKIKKLIFVFLIMNIKMTKENQIDIYFNVISMFLFALILYILWK
jgi:hypothetical protein